tara:strand:+ start:2795 stop:2995 length:201 start_codon:yes stop_codon:yes gene_type:complete
MAILRFVAKIEKHFKLKWKKSAIAERKEKGDLAAIQLKSTQVRRCILRSGMMLPSLHQGHIFTRLK